MAEGTTATDRGTCFVVMGFGKKPDFETGRTLDLDLTYEYIIKPSVEAARLKCIRADEIVHSGLIDVPMYEYLLNADVVIADLSTSNKNAYYELGVRHALKPYTTIIICEDGVKTFPFDTNHNLIRQYHHMETGIDYKEVLRFSKLLTEAINKILEEDPRPSDSPVYTFLNNLTPPALAEAMQGVAEAAAKSAPGSAGGESDGEAGDTATHRVLMQQVEKAQKKSDFVTAKALLSTIREMMKPKDEAMSEDPYIIQQLALVTYKSKLPTPQQALEEARALLEILKPETSNDTETLGLWGAVHKRLWEITADPARLDEAVRGYERGFYLRNDYYNGINLAYLLNIRAAHAASRAEAVADFVQAGRVRREVIQICEALLKNENLPEADKYWTMATMAEAYLGIGDETNAQQKFQEASAIAPADWMKDSTREQMDKLRAMLKDSPLKYVRESGESGE
jgi:tetratricopeptide (TPR) repeat protein